MKMNMTSNFNLDDRRTNQTLRPHNDHSNFVFQRPHLTFRKNTTFSCKINDFLLILFFVQILNVFCFVLRFIYFFNEKNQGFYIFFWFWCLYLVRFTQNLRAFSNYRFSKSKGSNFESIFRFTVTFSLSMKKRTEDIINKFLCTWEKFRIHSNNKQLSRTTMAINVYRQ